MQLRLSLGLRSTPPTKLVWAQLVTPPKRRDVTFRTSSGMAAWDATAADRRAPGWAQAGGRELLVRRGVPHARTSVRRHGPHRNQAMTMTAATPLARV